MTLALTGLMSMLASAPLLRRCELRYLHSGHSHEDLDALFGVIDYEMKRNADLDLHTPQDINNFLQIVLQKPRLLSQEKEKKVCVVKTVRDWRFFSYQSALYDLFARI